jgi:hypothetical protein
MHRCKCGDGRLFLLRLLINEEHVLQGHVFVKNKVPIITGMLCRCLLMLAIYVALYELTAHSRLHDGQIIFFLVQFVILVEEEHCLLRLLHASDIIFGRMEEGLRNIVSVVLTFQSEKFKVVHDSCFLSIIEQGPLIACYEHVA